MWESPVPALPASVDGCDPRSVFEAIRDVAGDDCPLVADCGTATPYLAAYWTVTTPGRSLILARGHGPMGYAFPGAVGLALAHPDEPVIAIVTDGSLLMAVGALEPVARLHLPITFVHLANGTLGWIKALQHFYFGARYLSTDISRFDAVGIARGFGVEACHVRDIAELSDQVRRGLESHRPLFIDVPIPSEHERIPPVAAWAESLRRGVAARPVY